MLDLHNVDFMNENTTSSLGKPFSLIAEKEKKNIKWSKKHFKYLWRFI